MPSPDREPWNEQTAIRLLKAGMFLSCAMLVLIVLLLDEQRVRPE